MFGARYNVYGELADGEYKPLDRRHRRHLLGQRDDHMSKLRQIHLDLTEVGGRHGDERVAYGLHLGGIVAR